MLVSVMLSLKHINPMLYDKATNGYSISINPVVQFQGNQISSQIIRAKKRITRHRNLNGLLSQGNRDLFPGPIDSMPVLQGFKPCDQRRKEKNPVVYILLRII